MLKRFVFVMLASWLLTLACVQTAPTLTAARTAAEDPEPPPVLTERTRSAVA